ncbi:MAG TPA: LLM class flavin-dependent oxidoreductase [Candidatus Limnocylindrales bacterium]|nr:LLM class flavin-dependent oxidoreductase [Candidatus Limnocylindrales bacterium]
MTTDGVAGDRTGAAGIRFGFIPTEGGRMFREALAEVELGEALGFDSVWIEEHHGVRDHYWPSPLVAAAAFAARTSRIALGTDVIVASFYGAVRLAEDVAVLEALSDGRFTLGVGLGYKPDEFALYDAPLERRGERLEELLPVLRALWRGERVDHEGRHLVVHGSIEPVPPTPPAIWIGGWGPKTLERAARLADAWVPGPTADLARLAGLRRDYDAALVAAGRDPTSVPRPLTRDVVIAETDAEAWRLAERHLLVSYRDEYGGSWRHPIIGATDSPRVDSLDELVRDRLIVGGPERCIRQLRRFVDELGVDQVIFRLYFPGVPHEHVVAELKLLAGEVIPAFR